MSSQSQPQFIDVPTLLVEARFRDRPLASRLLRAGDRRGFFVGGARGADAPIDIAYLSASDGAPANDNHLLVEPSGAGFLVNLSPAMRAGLEGTPTHLRIPCGEVVFDISAAAAPPAVPRPWVSARGKDLAPYAIGVVVVISILLAIIQMVPSDPRSLSLDDIGRTVRLSDYRITPPIVPEPPPAKGGALAGGAGHAAAGAEGELGDKHARPANTRRQQKGPSPQSAARYDAKYVVDNSMLSILANSPSAPLAEILADKAALGPNASDVLAHLTGTDVAMNAFGTGLGMRGTGEHGGGTGERMIGSGSGGLRTIGTCTNGERCTGAGLRYARGGGDFDGRRKARVPEVVPGETILRGALDKEIVRRIVRRHLNEVRYCYEQSLVRRPSLSGRVVASFTIAGTGLVMSSVLQSSTLGEPAAESCIVNAIRRWDFPKPQGGGLVIVSYPFQLSPAGG